MANKILFQIAPIADSNPIIAGTVPLGKEWIISLLTVTNLSDPDLREFPSSIKYKIHTVMAGESPATKNCLAFYPGYAPHESIHQYTNIRLGPGESIVIYNTAGRINVQAFGSEAPIGREDGIVNALNAMSGGGCP